MKFLLVPLTTLLLIMLPPLCSCLPNEKISEEDYNNYDLILKGSIESITIEEQERVLCLEVDVAYKGTAEQQQVQIRTPYGNGLCGINAGTDDEWLIFAHWKEGEYSTNMCTRSKNLEPENHMYRFQKEEIKEDLAFLEQKLPRSK